MHQPGARHCTGLRRRTSVQSLCQHGRQRGPKAGPWEILAVSAKEKLFPALSHASLLAPCHPHPRTRKGLDSSLPSPNLISTAITYRMVCGMEFYTFSCNCPLLTSEVGQVRPPSWGLSFPTCEMGVKNTCLSPQDCSVRNTGDHR